MDQLATLLAACSSDKDRDRLQTLIAPSNVGDNKNLAAVIESLFEQVDQSDFSLSDWVAALLGFDRWLENKRIAARPVKQMISYIHCCTLTLTDTLLPPDLTKLTHNLLEQYGFDACKNVTAG